MGKSTARRYLTRTLPGRVPGLETVAHECHHSTRPNEGEFFSDILLSVGHNDPFSGTVSRKRHRLVSRLATIADQGSRNHLVFFADDAQNLLEAQYEWLMDLHNELREQQIAFSTFLFGQSELLNQRSAFLAADKRQLVGRLMVHDFAFSGIKSEAELRYCLCGYDKTEHPSDSGWSFTRYYFPEAYAAGWRLSLLASDLWSVFREVAETYAASKDEEVSMQYFIDTIHSLLKTVGPASGHVPAIDQALLTSLVMESGYASFCQNSELDRTIQAQPTK